MILQEILIAYTFYKGVVVMLSRIERFVLIATVVVSLVVGVSVYCYCNHQQILADQSYKVEVMHETYQRMPSRFYPVSLLELDRLPSLIEYYENRPKVFKTVTPIVQLDDSTFIFPLDQFIMD